jgi:hypothetical protein
LKTIISNLRAGLKSHATHTSVPSGRRLMTKSDWADYSKTFECKEQEKFKIGVYYRNTREFEFFAATPQSGFFQ